jgi:hypothetical protein
MTRKLSLRTDATLRRKMLGASLAAGLVLAGASVIAGARQHRYHELISGSAAPSSFDSNGDGSPGHYVTFVERSSLGPVHGALMVEYDFAHAMPDAACPAERPVKTPVVVSSGNRALTGTEGQIFMQDDAATALVCLDPLTGAFNMSLRGIRHRRHGEICRCDGDLRIRRLGQRLALGRSRAALWRIRYRDEG